MADFEICYSWMLDNEDAGRKYATVPDTGGRAISGINSASYPGDFMSIQMIHPDSARADMVKDFYSREFWNKWYEQLTSDEVAKRVFDAAVNMGPGTAVKLLQEAINESGSTAGNLLPLSEDGQWGPHTVEAANACSQSDLVEWFKTERVDHYEAIVAKNPANQKYLAAWTARASK